MLLFLAVWERRDGWCNYKSGLGWEMTLWASQTRVEHTDCSRVAFLFILVWQFTSITDVCTDPHKRNMEVVVGESKWKNQGVTALESNRYFLREWTVCSRFDEFILHFPYPIPAPNASSCRVGEPTQDIVSPERAGSACAQKYLVECWRQHWAADLNLLPQNKDKYHVSLFHTAASIHRIYRNILERFSFEKGSVRPGFSDLQHPRRKGT